MKTGIDFYMNKDVTIKSNDVIIGDHVAIDKGFYCTTQLEIGDYVHISAYVTVTGGKEAKLIMESFSGFAAGCRIACSSDSYTSGHLMNPIVPAKYRKVEITTVKMEKFSCLGTNCVVLPGVTIGEGSVVGANSLVTKSTEPWTIYVGTPARAVGVRPKEMCYEFAREMGYDF